MVNEALDTVSKGLLQRLEDLGNKRTSGNYSNYSAAEVGQNPTKNPGNLIGLLSLFNGISTFVGYLMPKPFFEKSSSGNIQPKAGRIRGFILFPRVFARTWKFEEAYSHSHSSEKPPANTDVKNSQEVIIIIIIIMSRREWIIRNRIITSLFGERYEIIILIISECCKLKL